MTDRRAFLTTGVAALAAPAQAQPGGVKTLFEHALPPIDLSRYELKALEVTYPPGAASQSHRHPGVVVGYVLEGSIRFGLAGKPETVLTAGQMFYESPDDIHQVSANASTTAPARMLAVMIVEKGKPISSRV
jgi:quercetin dioxygenase-like cupin family protein